MLLNLWIRCGFWRTLKICYTTYNLGPSPPAIVLKHLTSLPYTQLSLTKLKYRLKGLVQMYFKKMNGQRRYKYLVLGKDKSYFVKNKHSDSTKKKFETDIINMLAFLIDNIFVMFFNRQSAYLWIHTVIIFSPTCSFIRMRQTSWLQGFLK